MGAVKPGDRYLIPLFIVCAVALWLRLPFVSTGLPYFYNEDEAHHFNRLMNMVKSGDWNPDYFHKPSLHFYLRVPVVAASFLSGVSRGQIRSIQEVKTRDKFGLAGYAFTASHPGFVKWNRLFTVGLSLLLVLLTYGVTRELTQAGLPALLAAFLVAVSPDVTKHSATIGVDMLMALMCLLSVYLAMRLYDRFTLAGLALAGLVSGLAVSSKYNALPIALLPLVVCLLSKRVAPAYLFTAIILPPIGFFLGSPYILSHFPTFLDQLAYEVWHYGVASHVGHFAEPGLPQLKFYASWLAFSATSSITLLLAIAGFLAALVSFGRKGIILAFFPAVFGALMLSQRANFTRNMLSIIPFVCIFAVLAIYSLCVSAKLRGVNLSNRGRAVGFALFILVTSLKPLLSSLSISRAAAESRDTRDEAARWLKDTNLEGCPAKDAGTKQWIDTALSGQLLMPMETNTLPAVSSFDQTTSDLTDLYLQGFGRVVYSGKADLSQEQLKSLELERRIPGAQKHQRIVKNPQVEVYRIKAEAGLMEKALERARTSGQRLTIDLVAAQQPNTLACGSGASSEGITSSEGHCWIQTTASLLQFINVDRILPQLRNTDTVTIAWSLMSPWPHQSITVQTQDWKTVTPLPEQQVGLWHQFELQIPRTIVARAEPLEVTISQVHSPKTQGLSEDARRLGIAVKDVKFVANAPH